MGVGMSSLVDRAIVGSQLDDVLSARRAGTLTTAQVERIRSSDLLVLGALADRVRAEEVGDEVRIYTDEVTPDAASDVVVLPRTAGETTGLELLREVAVARTTGPRGVCVRVDWTRCGLELAQIALGFGANELAGRIASKRGLPLAEGEKLGVGKKSRLELADVVKRRELEGFVRRAGRTPAFVQENP
jgi:2-iminoacetate synthase ThiH